MVQINPFTAAVGNVGALGSFTAALLSPAAIAENGARIRSLTRRTFSDNLFVVNQPNPVASYLGLKH
ncbi:MAG: nitronate monooxygenase [Cytophagaceae bacterium]|nr:nitronate monooxygenase [Cytophagaceae bacterium]